MKTFVKISKFDFNLLTNVFDFLKPAQYALSHTLLKLYNWYED